MDNKIQYDHLICHNIDYGLGQANDRGYHLLQFCAINELVITNTLFKHTKARRVTWTSPDGGAANQIDYIIVQQ